MNGPPTMQEADERGLVVEKGIHTFSNGTEWERWSSGNCFRCKFYDVETAGRCAFEGYSMLGMVSPTLAELFGWTRHEKYPESFVAPDSCRFFAERDENDGGRTAPPPFTDPAQLVLIADPTEVIANLTPAETREPANA